MDFKDKWAIIDGVKPHPQFALIGGVAAGAIGGTAAIGAGVALGGVAAGAMGGGLLGGGSAPSGGSSGGGGGGSTGGSSTSGIPIGVLQQILGTSSAMNDLFGTGPSSLSGMTQKAASAADPFAPNRAGYASSLQGSMSQLQNIAGATATNPWGASQMNTMSDVNPASAALNSATGGNTVNPALTALATPTSAQSFAYQTGLDAMQRSAAAGHYSGSSQQMMEAQAYGQKSGAQFQQQDFNNLVTAQGVSNATQQQNYGQQLSTAQNNQAAMAQQFAMKQSNMSLGMAQDSLAFGQQSTIAQMQAQLGGANTGSPAQAGNILAGQYGNQQTALLGLMQSIQGGSQTGTLGTAGNGIGSALGQAASGVSNWFAGSGSTLGPATGSTDYGSANAITGSVTAPIQPTITDLGDYTGGG